MAAASGALLLSGRLLRVSEDTDTLSRDEIESSGRILAPTASFVSASSSVDNSYFSSSFVSPTPSPHPKLRGDESGSGFYDHLWSLPPNQAPPVPRQEATIHPVETHPPFKKFQTNWFYWVPFLTFWVGFMILTLLY
uniref:Uncharacterized protein n=2 Tax=Ditylum brightwellii TaxID=49249 RepID=A0A7S2EG55_9STRA